MISFLAWPGRARPLNAVVLAFLVAPLTAWSAAGLATATPDWTAARPDAASSVTIVPAPSAGLNSWSTGGGASSGLPPSHTDNGVLRNAASGQVDSYAQRLLNKVGTAQITTGLGNGFKNGSADLLVPLFDRPQDLVFTQYGVRRSDAYTESYRTTVNVGVGYRHLLANRTWMIGGNVFYDRDITRQDQRLGLGLEAKRDFFTMSTNAYLRMSNWRDSDVVGYRERPANGFDMKATGYLPSYPQLGASIGYEKYYGSNVGLFGPSTLQKNPEAVSVGLMYQPIPLIGVGLQYRQGDGGHSEVYGHLTLTYQPGMPWADQWKPSKVVERRRLASTRYALVDRHNTIVLQYRKVDAPVRTATAVSVLAAPTTIAATGTTTSTLTATVRDQNGAPVGAGITVNWKTNVGALATSSSVTNASGTATNTLTSTTSAGVADVVASVGGLTSDANVTFSTTATTYTDSVTASSSSILADGTSTSTLTATVKDSSGNAVGSGVSVAWTTTSGTLAAASSTTDSSGRATVVLTSSTTVGHATVTANVTGGTASTSVTFTAPAYEVTDIYSTGQQAAGNDMTITSVVGTGSTPAPAGTTVTYAADGGTLSATSATTTDATGQTSVTFTIPSNAVNGDQYAITATVGSSSLTTYILILVLPSIGLH